MGDLRETIVSASEERPSPSPSPSSSSNPSPSTIGAERWARAEEASQKIIRQVQPTAVSEERRRAVIDYVQRLVRGYLGCEVFPFGSVPLKTYLPDGDIDLTAFGGASVEDFLVNALVSVLEAEDKNRDAEFIVKDVQLIRAEVKLVKCIVQNIVVDISFNQLGGLCTLCFLEQVDRLIGKDHLFKRSIILIKAWCYYESRILGAHHGLISTYALETLVLYIFHFFHSTLDGPLAVLYRFLDYFSKFDWDSYCISLSGPVHISSLPEIVAEKPENGGSDLLLGNDFLRYCTDMYSVPSRGIDMSSRTFSPKHLNIIDPLKENNNLGRSVSKGNFYRIRSAFTYGARKLGQILLQPEDNIAGELHKFFSNTLDRHGSGQRPDVQDPIPMPDHSGFVPPLSLSEASSGQEEKAVSHLISVNSSGINGKCKLDPDGILDDGGDNIQGSGIEIRLGKNGNGHQKGAVKVIKSTLSAEADNSLNSTGGVAHRFSGDAEDLATSRIHNLKISNHSPKAGSLPNRKDSVSQQDATHYAPNLYFSRYPPGNQKVGYGNLETKELEYPGVTVDRVSFGPLLVPDEGKNISVGHGRDNNLVVANLEVSNDVSVSSPVACSMVGFSPGYQDKNSDMKSLSDLSGDYDNHRNSLHLGRWCYEHSLSMPPFPMPPALPSQFQTKNSWDLIQNTYPFKRNGFSNTNTNGIIPGPAFYHMNSLLIPGAPFGVDEMPKPRGTGTYFPNMNLQNRPSYQKPLTGRGRSQGQMRSPRNNGRSAMPMEANLQDQNGRELLQAQFSDHGNGKPMSSDLYESVSHVGKVHPEANGFPLPSEGVVELGSIGHVPSGVPVTERSRQQNPASLPSQTSNQNSPPVVLQKQKPTLGPNQYRAKSSYRLKDEDDFPPLSI